MHSSDPPDQRAKGGLMTRDLISRPDWSVQVSTADIETGAATGLDAYEVAQAALSVPSDLDTDLAASWALEGGVSIRLGVAQAAVKSVLNQLEPDLAREVLTSFNRLPSGIRNSVYREFSLGSSGYVKSASNDEVSAFSKSEDGAELVREWRGKAGRNVAVVRNRLNRLMSSMNEADRETAWGWFGGLDATAAMTVLRELAR
jgi:hypothetical protein